MSRIAGAKIELRRGALPAPMKNARATWTERRGLLLTLTTDDGVRGLGEASPLPGYSPDRLEDCEAALANIDWRDVEWASIDSAHLAGLPAARFAVESALLDLRGKATGTTAAAQIAGRLGGGQAKSCPIAGLLAPGPAEAVADAARAAVARGVRTLKLKIDGDERDVAIVAAVRRAVGPAIALRLDANQCLDPTAHAAYLAALAAHHIELIEEPFAPGPDAGSAPIPVAADESLHRGGSIALTASSVVLKPMALGLSRCLALAVEARRRGLAVIVSHLFDGPVAHAAASALALAIGDGAACGLDRHAGLTAWPATTLPHLGLDRISATSAAGLGVPLGDLG